MNETRICPYCAEEIRKEAIKCRYCGSRLTGRPSVLSWTRSEEWRMAGGVCAGLAREFDISATAIRLCFVLATLMGFGVAIPIYVVLWIIMPLDSELDPYREGIEREGIEREGFERETPPPP